METYLWNVKRRTFIKYTGYVPLVAASSGCLDDRDGELENETNDTDTNETRSETSNRSDGGKEYNWTDELFVETPYGDEIEPRRLTVESRGEHDIEITVTGPDRELYHAEGYLGDTSFATRETVAVGRPGNYTVTATIDGENFEETWRVEPGFHHFLVDLDEPVLRNQERSATVALTRVPGTPPDVEPSPFDAVSNIEPLGEVLERMEDCEQDDSRDYCLYDDHGNSELLTATYEVSGTEYSKAAVLRDRLPRLETSTDEYPIGYYFENSGQVYRVFLDETRGPPVY